MSIVDQVYGDASPTPSPTPKAASTSLVDQVYDAPAPAPKKVVPHPTAPPTPQPHPTPIAGMQLGTPAPTPPGVAAQAFAAGATAHPAPALTQAPRLGTGNLPQLPTTQPTGVQPLKTVAKPIAGAVDTATAYGDIVPILAGAQQRGYNAADRRKSQPLGEMPQVVQALAKGHLSPDTLKALREKYDPASREQLQWVAQHGGPVDRWYAHQRLNHPLLVNAPSSLVEQLTNLTNYIPGLATDRAAAGIGKVAEHIPAIKPLRGGDLPNLRQQAAEIGENAAHEMGFSKYAPVRSAARKAAAEGKPTSPDQAEAAARGYEAHVQRGREQAYQDAQKVFGGVAGSKARQAIVHEIQHRAHRDYFQQAVAKREADLLSEAEANGETPDEMALAQQAHDDVLADPQMQKHYEYGQKVGSWAADLKDVPDLDARIKAYNEVYDPLLKRLAQNKILPEDEAMVGYFSTRHLRGADPAADEFRLNQPIRRSPSATPLTKEKTFLTLAERLAAAKNGGPLSRDVASLMARDLSDKYQLLAERAMQGRLKDQGLIEQIEYGLHDPQGNLLAHGFGPEGNKLTGREAAKQVRRQYLAELAQKHGFTPSESLRRPGKRGVLLPQAKGLALEHQAKLQQRQAAEALRVHGSVERRVGGEQNKLLYQGARKTAALRRLESRINARRATVATGDETWTPKKQAFYEQSIADLEAAGMHDEADVMRSLMPQKPTAPVQTTKAAGPQAETARVEASTVPPASAPAPENIEAPVKALKPSDYGYPNAKKVYDDLHERRIAMRDWIKENVGRRPTGEIERARTNLWDLIHQEDEAGARIGVPRLAPQGSIEHPQPLENVVAKEEAPPPTTTPTGETPTEGAPSKPGLKEPPAPQYPKGKRLPRPLAEVERDVKRLRASMNRADARNAARAAKRGPEISAPVERLANRMFNRVDSLRNKAEVARTVAYKRQALNDRLGSLRKEYAETLPGKIEERYPMREREMNVDDQVDVALRNVEYPELNVGEEGWKTKKAIAQFFRETQPQERHSTIWGNLRAGVRTGIVTNPVYHGYFNVGNHFLAGGGDPLTWMNGIAHFFLPSKGRVARWNRYLEQNKDWIAMGDEEGLYHHIGQVFTPSGQPYDIGGASPERFESDATTILTHPVQDAAGGDTLTPVAQWDRAILKLQRANTAYTFDTMEKFAATELFKRKYKQGIARGLKPEEARARASIGVRQALGDYANVSGRGVEDALNRMFLFYPWMKTSAKFWPGKMTHLEFYSPPTAFARATRQGQPSDTNDPLEMGMPNPAGLRRSLPALTMVWNALPEDKRAEVPAPWTLPFRLATLAAPGTVSERLSGPATYAMGHLDPALDLASKTTASLHGFAHGPDYARLFDPDSMDAGRAAKEVGGSAVDAFMPFQYAQEAVRSPIEGALGFAGVRLHQTNAARATDARTAHMKRLRSKIDHDLVQFHKVSGAQAKDRLQSEITKLQAEYDHLREQAP